MRCIFCKKASDDSRSVEHIIPESLGNTTQVLPRGVVCDKCNNYFARKVEKPFLDVSGITDLRSYQFIPNKKGVIPPGTGYINSEYPVKVFPHKEGSTKASIAVESELFEKVLSENELILVLSTGCLPSQPNLVSRFLAKIAVEAFAQRLLNTPGGLDYLIDESQFDSIRNHARLGKPQEWAYHTRPLYGAKEKRINSNGESYQVVYEYDLFWTPLQELYFVLVLFGLELTINVGGPDVDGYLEWLKEKNGISPLYEGKNANII